jgi:hypothetical protein
VEFGGYTHRAIRRKTERGLVRLRVILIEIDQFTLTRKPGMALNRLSKDGGSKRPLWEYIGTMRRNEKSSGKLALVASHAISWSE